MPALWELQEGCHVTGADVMQAVNSLDGAVEDAVTLIKPAGWRPDQSARLHTLALFHANYTPSWVELSGINGPAEELILGPAEALLFSEPELLNSLRNATLVQVPHSVTSAKLHSARLTGTAVFTMTLHTPDYNSPRQDLLSSWDSLWFSGYYS